MPAIYVPKRPEEIDIIVNRVWSLLDEPRVSAARNIIEKLISDITPQITTENPILLRSLARAYHAAGYVTGLSTRTSEIAVPLHHYQQLEEIARLINDDTLLNIALTYQGDMVRRHGDVIKAIVYLEAARDYYSDT